MPWSTVSKSKTVPTFAEPTPPKPDAEGGTTPKPLMECTIKSRKVWDDEDQWEESRGRLFRTILSICTAPLCNKLAGESKFSDLEKDHDVSVKACHTETNALCSLQVFTSFGLP